MKSLVAPLLYALSPAVKTVPGIASSSFAVASSSAEEQLAMSPAPTSVTVAVVAAAALTALGSAIAGESLGTPGSV